ncbi:TPA_asm: protein 3 [Luffa virus 1]|uniref:Protein 3 n=1 Tax=Luffa virus 1 TaxID=2977973 RepID=A0A9N7AAM8_9RHAB|nr:TPA_asm: protein 3 [Luffa virus 1]
MARISTDKKPEKVLDSSSSGKLITVIHDENIPSHVPRTKITIGRRWIKRPSAVGVSYDLGAMSIFGGIMATFKGTKELSHPEIHVIWHSYCPSETFQNNVIVSLSFNQAVNDEQKLIGQHISPMHMPVHHIFYPRQTIAVGVNSQFPWSVGFDIEDFAVKESFQIGKLEIFLRGYTADGTSYTQGKESELIMLAPTEDVVDGATRVSRPRIFGEDWMIGGYKLGSFKASDVLKVKMLQEEGVDIEALYLTKRLVPALKCLKNVTAQNVTRPEIRKAALGNLLRFLA